MAREHKDFDAIIKDLNVELTSDDTLMEFPTLYKVDSKGKTRMFKLYIRLVKTPENRDKSYGWNILEDVPVKIKSKHWNGHDLPANVVVQSWTNDGVVGGKIKVNPPTYSIAKSVRNALQTAIIAGQDKQLKKLKDGMVTDLNKKVTSQIYFPMLADNYHDFADTIKFPCYIQPKLDGHRFVSYLDSDKNVQMFTRNGHYDVGKDYLKVQLKPILVKYFDEKNNESLYIDGEVYKHGMRLQDISSEARNTGKNREVSESLDYNIFDVYYPNNPLVYADRLKIVKEIFNGAQKVEIKAELNKLKKSFSKMDMSYDEKTIDSIKSELVEMSDSDLRDSISYKCIGNICMVPTYPMQNYFDIEWMFNLFIMLKYEGAIIRTNTPYKTGLSNPKGMRSKGLLKYKARETSEFEITGYTTGKKGRAQNQIIWICKNNLGKEFKVTPNIPDGERVKLYEECEKNKGADYIGQMYEVAYSKLSNAGVPLDAKGIIFRPYK